jgi:hypothetical protein
MHAAHLIEEMGVEISHMRSCQLVASAHERRPFLTIRANPDAMDA